MRSTSHNFNSHANPYATSSYSNQSSSSGLYSYSNRSTATGLHSTTSYGKKRFSSSTSSTTSSAEPNFTSLDYGQLVSSNAKPSNAGSRNITRRSSSLACPAIEHKSPEINVDKGTQWQYRRDKDNGSLVTGNEWLGGHSGLKIAPENNRSVRRSSGFGGGDGSIKVENSDQNYGTPYRKTSVDHDSSTARKLKSSSGDYRNASLRRQPAISSETYEAISNAVAAVPQCKASVQRACSAPNTIAVDQQIFLKRLLHAHDMVDDMLRSRGMNPDDERAYLRYLEHVPETKEEEQPLSRVDSSLSVSGSDSGLSLDNDSEESIHFEYVPSEMPLEENVDIEKAFANDDFKEELVEQLILYKEVLHESNALTAKLAKKPSTSRSKVTAAPKERKNDGEKLKGQKANESATRTKKPSKKTIAQRTLEALFQHRRKVRSSAEISIQHVSFYQIAQSLTEQKPVEKVVRIHFRLTQRPHAILRTAIKLPQSSRTLHVTLNVSQPKSRPPKDHSKTIEISQLKSSEAPLSPTVLRTPLSPSTILRKTIPAHVRRNNTISRVQIPESFLKPLNPVNEMTRTKQYQDLDEALRLARDNLKRVAFNQTISAITSDNSGELRQAESKTRNEKQEERSEKESLKTTVKINEAKSKDSDVKAPKTDTLSTRTNLFDQTSMKNERQLAYAQKTQSTAKNIRNLSTIRIEAAFDNNRTRKCLEEGDNERRSVRINEKRTLRRALTCISDEEVRKALQKAKTNDATDRTLINEFRRNKMIPAPQAIIHAELPPIIAPPTRILNVKPVRDFVAPLPPAQFLRRRTPERFLLETALSSERLPNKCETSEIMLRPVNRILKPISMSNSTRRTGRTPPPASALQQQQPCDGTTESPFGVRLKRVDRRAIKHSPRGAVMQSTAKKPWIPKWRRVERSEEEEVEEEGQAEESAETREYSEQGNSLKSGESQERGRDEKENVTMSEAEKAMLAVKKRQLEEDVAKLLSYEERRRLEREREKEELRALKEKQERRRQEREEEERQFAEKKRQEDECRRQEEEERKERVEAEKRKKDDKRKKEQLLRDSFLPASGLPNFVIPSKTDRTDKFGNIVQAKHEMGMTKEQQEEAKRSFLASVQRLIAFEGLSDNQLRNKIRYLHQRINKLEADKYDLERRHERQQYDLKELNERQRQMARNKAIKKGIDPFDAVTARYPPKIPVASKYDRQIDRRNFSERRAIFENKNAFPCFPNMPPPPSVCRNVILTFDMEHYQESH